MTGRPLGRIPAGNSATTICMKGPLWLATIAWSHSTTGKGGSSLLIALSTALVVSWKNALSAEKLPFLTAATSYININVDHGNMDTNRSVAIAEGQAYVNHPDESPDSVGLNVNWAATPQPIVITDNTGTTNIENLAVASTWTNTDAGSYSQHAFSGLEVSVSGDGADDLGKIVFEDQFFETADDAYFQNGKLNVSGSGFVYEVDAANGDPTTFLLNLTEEGVTTGYTVPWSSRFDPNEFDPSNVDIGL